MSSFTEPISPELVLVSPELAAIARAGLPDRPWEAFLPAADPADNEVARLRPPATPPRPSPAAEPAPDAAVVPSRRATRRRPRVPVGLILLTAFTGLVTAGSVLPVRDAPTLGPPPARANGLTTTPVTPSTSQEPTVRPAPAPPTIDTNTNTGTAPAVSLPSSTTPTPHPDPAPRPAAPRVLPSRVQPYGGYVFARGLGLLRVDAGARSIVELHANVGCGGELVVRRIRITLDGRFSARRLSRGPGRPSVTVTGVFARAGTVHGTIRVTKGRCASGLVRFTGRLS
jgi:hypothetical protein